MLDVKIAEDANPVVSEIKLNGLVETVDPESVRVRTESGRCDILEVASAVEHRAVEVESDTGPQAEARALLEQKRDALSTKKSELQRIKQRDDLLQVRRFCRGLHHQHQP